MFNTVRRMTDTNLTIYAACHVHRPALAIRTAPWRAQR